MGKDPKDFDYTTDHIPLGPIFTLYIFGLDNKPIQKHKRHRVNKKNM